MRTTWKWLTSNSYFFSHRPSSSKVQKLTMTQLNENKNIFFSVFIINFQEIENSNDSEILTGLQKPTLTSSMWNRNWRSFFVLDSFKIFWWMLTVFCGLLWCVQLEKIVGVGWRVLRIIRRLRGMCNTVKLVDRIINQFFQIFQSKTSELFINCKQKFKIQCLKLKFQFLNIINTLTFGQPVGAEFFR